MLQLNLGPLMTCNFVCFKLTGISTCLYVNRQNEGLGVPNLDGLHFPSSQGLKRILGLWITMIPIEPVGFSSYTLTLIINHIPFVCFFQRLFGWKALYLVVKRWLFNCHGNSVSSSTSMVHGICIHIYFHSP